MKHLLDFLFDTEYPEVFEVKVDNQFYHVYLVVSDLIKAVNKTTQNCEVSNDLWYTFEAYMKELMKDRFCFDRPVYAIGEAMKAIVANNFEITLRSKDTDYMDLLHVVSCEDINDMWAK